MRSLQAFQKIIDRVAKKIELKAVPVAQYYYPDAWEAFMGMGTDILGIADVMAASGSNGTVLFGTETDTVTDYQLSGIIAHELAHEVLDHRGVSVPEHELAADAYAATHGYREQTLSALRSGVETNPEFADLATDTHPSFNQRIQAVERLATK